MVSWTLFAFECSDVDARGELMEWFQNQYTVEFSTDGRSAFAEIPDSTGDTQAADFAWVGRYLYVTIIDDAPDLLDQTVHHWERAVAAAFDGDSETVVDGTFVDATGGVDQITSQSLEGPPELAGNGLMYALAMKHQFRFRSYSERSPTDQETPHPDAFTDPTEFVDDFLQFVDDMREATGVEPTKAGMQLLKNDPIATQDQAPHETATSTAKTASDGGVDQPDATEAEAEADTTADQPQQAELKRRKPKSQRSSNKSILDKFLDRFR
jgi:hypothetical protein